jgi:hypothetical protein
MDDAMIELENRSFSGKMARASLATTLLYSDRVDRSPSCVPEFNGSSGIEEVILLVLSTRLPQLFQIANLV